MHAGDMLLHVMTLQHMMDRLLYWLLCMVLLEMQQVVARPAGYED